MAVGWQQVHDEALRRIQSREWTPGSLIPNEAKLAREFGCARATVNRALRALAEVGLLERRRKAGTRVALTPQRRAQIAIPLIRQEIEARGETCTHRILLRSDAELPRDLGAVLDLPNGTPAQHVATLYLADGHAFAVEDRWVHLAAAPGFATAPLDQVNPNEWLVQNAPFDHGTLEYSAHPASDQEAAHLGCQPGSAIMVLERCTFGPKAGVTHVRLAYAPGQRLRLHI